MKNRGSGKHGFTFIEIMVVVIIMGILGAIIAVKLTGRTEEARINAARTQIDAFCSALDAYEMDSGTYPTTAQGLAALQAEPSTDPKPLKWKGPYIQKAEFKDPWGSDYKYSAGKDAKNNTKSYDLWSLGPDRKDASDDDISNWKK